MFDIGWSELIVIGVVALVVIGPKELPGVIRSVGRAVTKLRTMAGEFRGQFDEAMREAELHDVKKTFTDMGEAASSAASVITNPVGTVLNEVKSAAAGTTGVTEANQALQSIQADALALEAELKQQASPAAMPETPPPETAKP